MILHMVARKYAKGEIIRSGEGGGHDRRRRKGGTEVARMQHADA